MLTFLLLSWTPNWIAAFVRYKSRMTTLNKVALIEATEDTVGLHSHPTLGPSIFTTISDVPPHPAIPTSHLLHGKNHDRLSCHLSVP